MTPPGAGVGAAADAARKAAGGSTSERDEATAAEPASATTGTASSPERTAETMPSIAEATETLGGVVHHPVRLGVLTVLRAVDRAAFPYLRETLEVTDGNLSRNISVLEDAGLVTVEKGYEGKRPRTWVAATPEGLSALDAHLAALRALAGWEPPAGD